MPVVLLIGRLPLPAIIILAGTMRGLLHLYYGAGGFVWALVWGSAAVWIYYRFRRLWWLIVMHGLWNAPGLLVDAEDALTLLGAALKIVISLGFAVWWVVLWYRVQPLLRRKVRWIDYRISAAVRSASPFGKRSRFCQALHPTDVGKGTPNGRSPRSERVGDRVV
ncbi:CPBP family intramembrane metalloprotease (plasmid) [Rhodococcus pseudokoreensis]|uniref:CPBP family intramembrane metalloprotease n=1 Tax=Rhodococcus pseudokoreensis TaxID=2811421 RepID=A0A974VZ99_9NOCA|nr:CPBP family intramembrane metalloprotease [Rhodococcus pseudokoreensis]